VCTCVHLCPCVCVCLRVYQQPRAQNLSLIQIRLTSACTMYHDDWCVTCSNLTSTVVLHIFYLALNVQPTQSPAHLSTCAWCATYTKSCKAFTLHLVCNLHKFLHIFYLTLGVQATQIPANLVPCAWCVTYTITLYHNSWSPFLPNFTN
jgi:hypothetical protein